jgi:hypothetical protein
MCVYIYTQLYTHMRVQNIYHILVVYVYTRKTLVLTSKRWTSTKRCKHLQNPALFVQHLRTLRGKYGRFQLDKHLTFYFSTHAQAMNLEHHHHLHQTVIYFGGFLKWGAPIIQT